MYCSSCAAVLDPNQTVCLRCGRPVGPPPPAQAVPSTSVVGSARPVRLAVILLFVSMMASPLSLLMYYARYPNARFQALPTLLSLVFVVVWLVVLTFLWRGQAWARIVTLLLVLWFFGNLALNLSRVAGSGSAISGAFAIPVVTSVVRVTALILLFMPTSNAWFARR